MTSRSRESVLFRQYFNVVYKRLPIILAITLIVTSAVALYMFRQPHEYYGDDADDHRAAENADNATRIRSTSTSGQTYNYYNTQLQLLHSPDLMKDVVIDLGLYRDPTLFGGQNRRLFSVTSIDDLK